MQKIRSSAINFGGSLDAFTSYMIERSLKTIVLRVRQQNQNAMEIAKFLETEKRHVKSVNYPGLKSNSGYLIAKKQMKEGFGGMLSFEIKNNPEKFLRKLHLIRRAISLGGVESTIAAPVKTSHAKLSPEERTKVGISNNLLRLSVGIEDHRDLIHDIQNAF